MNVLIDNRAQILESFGRTVELMVVGGLLALVLGTVVGAMRVSPIGFARFLGAAYVNLVRNTPLLLIMFLFVFGLPELGLRPALKIGTSPLLNFDVFFVFAAVAIGVYTAAFVCEAIRSGINSVPVGQAEAARSIGMGFMQTLNLVVLPQAFRAVIPPIVNVLIAMTKNTSVALGVGVTEATFMMKKLGNMHASERWWLFFGFAIGYMILVAVIAGIGSLLERKVRAA